MRFTTWRSFQRLKNTTSASLPHRGATGGRSRRVDGCRGCRWPPGYKPCSLEPYRPMLRPDQCRFAAPECVRWLCGIGPRSPSTTRDAPDQASASKGAHTERCRSGTRPLAAAPCLPEPGQTTGWSVSCRIVAGKHVRRLRSMLCAIGAILYPPYTPYARMREGPIGPCSGGCGDPGGPTHCTPGRRPTPRDPPGRRRAAEHASTVRI